jgi:hypothetical protein
MISVSPTGCPSKRSTARRFCPVARTCTTRAASAGRSHSGSGSGAERESGRRARHKAPALLREGRHTLRRRARHARRRASATAGRLHRAAPGRPQPERAARAHRGARAGARPLRQRELRSSKAFDEIPAPAHAQGLEVSQLSVHPRIATGNSFAANPVARDDPLALEEQLGEGAWIRIARRRAARCSPSVPASP